MKPIALNLIPLPAASRRAYAMRWSPVRRQEFALGRHVHISA